jgi:hypothetical protein
MPQAMLPYCGQPDITLKQEKLRHYRKAWREKGHNWLVNRNHLVCTIKSLTLKIKT